MSPTAPISGSVKVTLGTAWYSAARPPWPRIARTAMSAWYMAIWVNAPLPVASPTAHTPGAPGTRIRSSTGSARASSGTPSTLTPSRSSSTRRPAATSSRCAPSRSPRRPVTVNQSPDQETEAASVPVWTETPSVVSTRVSSSAASGSSRASSRGCDSSTVTAQPIRWSAWPSSRPTAPPPSTSSDSGSSGVSISSRLVQ